jgi:GntR family histidine utilization transcriptional repressor
VADLALTRYEQVKRYVGFRVRSGHWKAGDRIPSEVSLVAELGVSRMTINRALRELTRAGMLVRLSGVGTFVASSKPQSTLLMIAHVSDEIRARGHEYACAVLRAEREAAPPDVSAALVLTPGALVFHIICVHRENCVPVELEDCYVNPAVAPGFLDQDFTRVRPSDYLLGLLPVHEIEHIVDARIPTKREAELLEIELGSPCLALTQRSWLNDAPVTFSRLVHPGTRYRLGCRFKPDSMEQHA